MISLIYILISAVVILIVYVARSEFNNHEQLKKVRHVMSSREREWYHNVKDELSQIENSKNPDEEAIKHCKNLLRDIKSGRAFSLDNYTISN